MNGRPLATMPAGAPRFMYLAQQIAEVEERFGHPERLCYTAGFSAREFDLLRRCLRKGRAHDVTLFIQDGPCFALIRKPSYPPGLFRPPSGGIERGEAFAAGASREAYEETGLTICLERYLLRFDACFYLGDEAAVWTTYVFHARARDRELRVVDGKEIAEACWATPEAMQAVMRPRMLATGSAGMRYRVAIQDRALGLLGFLTPESSSSSSSSSSSKPEKQPRTTTRTRTIQGRRGAEG
jgi:ADP-ribose pyrophosphatase YjhB (NUDIX family)